MREITRHLAFAMLVCLMSGSAFAQTGQIQGTVSDPQRAVVINADVRAINQATGVERKTKTNSEGTYSFPFLDPGHYKVAVQASKFNNSMSEDLTLNVNQTLVMNFELKVGAVSDTVDVTAGAPLLNVTNGTVGTVVDRQFVANMPLNGRSFESLIELSAGVVYTVSGLNNAMGQQFAINGQRTDGNTFMVDGVSANTGVGTTILIGSAGTGNTGLTAANGGLNGLISVDNLQEFSIQTSTFAPEYGRSPGGQISMVTRSGSNRYSGSVFDYFRDSKFDANNWFNNRLSLAKPEARQNDFGGVFGGPVMKNKLFFFYSYEGLRLLQPANGTSFVPSATPGFGRTIVSSLQPFLQAYPLPNGPVNPANPHAAQFTGTWSNPTNLDNNSIRLDYIPTSKMAIFGRFSKATSDLKVRFAAFNSIRITNVDSTSFTVGGTYTITPTILNDLRVNTSWTTGGMRSELDDFAGAIPLPESAIFPPGFTNDNGQASISILNGGAMQTGRNVANPTQTINVIDSVSIVKGAHQFKFGFDYRRLNPTQLPRVYQIQYALTNPANYTNGTIDNLQVQARERQEYLFQNFSTYVQDTWKTSSRLTLTYGLRWDVNPGPTSPNDHPGFALTSLAAPVSSISARPLGTEPPYPTVYSNVGPRVGAAYQLSDSPKWGQVLRGGFGLFFDTADSASAGWVGPFSVNRTMTNVTYPASPNLVAPPSLPGVAPYFVSGAPAPDLKAPYTYQTNLTLEQALGSNQALTLSYVGAFGRRLLRSETFQVNSASVSSVNAVTNNASSSYNGLQIKFQRRLSRGLQALSSFTWAHSVDNASIPDTPNGNSLQPGFIDRDRADSDFDVRTTASTAVSYIIPTPSQDRFVRAVLGDWGTDLIYRYSGPSPFNVTGNTVVDPTTGTTYVSRPNVNPNVPFWVEGDFPGGRRVNIAAFTAAPAGTAGNFGRNKLRGFAAHQVDLAIRRDFRVYQGAHLQFRTDVFNLLNHPIFANPPVNLAQPATFGIANALLSSALTVSPGATSLYQIGAPRSFQFSLKLIF